MKFGSKAETLFELKKVLTTGQVLDLVLFSHQQWNDGQEAVLDQVQAMGSGYDVIVRSSSLNEDNEGSSNAGHFVSIPHVPLDDRDALKSAIEEVFASYLDGNPGNQVFVQRQLQGIRFSGVLFTKEIDCKSDYYVINFDESEGAFDTVTSGSTNELKTFVCFKGADTSGFRSEFQRLIAVAKELESLFGMDSLDIEFGIDAQDNLYIFQVRPLLGNIDEGEKVDLEPYLRKTYKKVGKLNLPHPSLYGTYTLFGVMPDWNPAEIIGIKPKKLAISLYKELITDRVWAYQRGNYGYKNLRSFPLLISFMGMPYIDVRVSFNSFIPQNLSEELSHKLANFYLDKLKASPTNHDKVEFNIIYSCYYFDIDERIAELKSNGFTEEEIATIKTELLGITNGILNPETGLMKVDMAKVSTLDARRQKVLDSDMYITDKIYWLIEECKRYGTLPFAGLARAGFVAVQMLDSLTRIGLLTVEEKDQFMGSVSTIAKQFSDDFAAFNGGTLDKTEFVEKYGHLRPGTYDILSPNYKAGFDQYFNDNNSQQGSHALHGEFELSAEKKSAIATHLKATGIDCGVEDLFDFFKTAIEQREYSKYIFTRCLNDVLEHLEMLGEKWGLSKEDLSHYDIKHVMEMYATLNGDDIVQRMREVIDLNKASYATTLKLKFPQLIAQPDDVFAFLITENEPNYITNNVIRSEVVLEEQIKTTDLKGKIVFLKSADPGYDWVFSHNIGGLITMFGGANSHMAIRSAELGIPAVIGAGEKLFNKWSVSPQLELDCLNRRITQL